MIAVSVIIPLYNCETHLEECLQSLLSQTLKNIEFIFVDDGSIDKSQEIIKNFAKNDSRIKLIIQKNQGVSIARNNGIQHAKGDYIGFVDGDDYVAPDLFEMMFDKAKKENLDILVSGYNKVSSNNLIEIKSQFQHDIVFNSEFIKQDLIKTFIQEDQLNSCWNKLYRAKLIKENNICFPKGMTNGEDGFFNIYCFYNAKQIMFINYSGYYYRELEGSATRDIISKDYFQIAVDRYKTDFKSIFKLEISQDIINDLKEKRFVNNIISIIHVYLNSKSKKNIWSRILYVKKIVNSKIVQIILTEKWELITQNKNKYDMWILKLIKHKSYIGLAVLVQVNDVKNKMKL